MKAKHLQQGEDAEMACCNYLQTRGLKLLKRNFRCRQGEIDLIMLDTSTLVFVEVRFRNSLRFGGGLESVTASKQNKLRKTAELYLQQNRQYENARIDVVSMSKNDQNVSSGIALEDNDWKKYHFDWINNAF